MDEEELESGGFGTSDWLKAIGGVLFFVAGLLPWWSYSFGEGGLHWEDNAFDYSLDGVIAYVIFVAIALVTIITQTGSLRLPAVFVHPTLLLGAAVVGSGLVAYRFFTDKYDNGSRDLGMYLAVAGALLVLAGCIIAFRERRLEPVDEDEYFDAPAPESGDLKRSHPPLP